MTSFHTKSFSYISDHKGTTTIVAFLTSTRPFFHSSIVPVTLGDEELYESLVSSSKTLENHLLRLFSLSQTMQFTQKISRAFDEVEDDDFHASILRHLIENTRYFCRSLKELAIPSGGAVTSLIITNNKIASSLVSLETLTLIRCETDSLPHFFSAVGNIRNLRTLTKRGYFEAVVDDTLAPLSRCVNLTSLDLSQAPLITGAGLAALGALKKLTNLNLRGCHQIDDDGLESGLSKVTSLTDLSIDSPLITDRGLEKVLMSLDFLRVLCLSGCTLVEGQSLGVMSSTSVERLQLDGMVTLCAEHCFETISELPNLFRLSLPFFNHEGLQFLAKNKTPVTQLSIHDCASLAEDGAKYFGEMTTLKSLLLYQSPQLTSEGLVHIAKLTSLTSLMLIGAPKVSDISCLKALTCLECFWCTDATELTDDSVVQLFTEGSFNRLEDLSFTGSAKLTDTSLKVMCGGDKFPSLTQLYLTELPLITDEGVRKLSSIKKLEYLDLLGCKGLESSGETAEYMRSTIPGLEVCADW